MCADSKMYVFGDGGSNNTLDPNLVAMMNNGGFGGNGMWNNPIWAIVFLAALRNGGIFGNDGNGNACGVNARLSQIQDTLNTNQGNQLLMGAIQGNATSIKELASAIGCNHNSVVAAINNVQTAICNVGSNNNMNAMQTMNAINSGNAMLANQLSSCCCEIKTETLKMGYENQINNERQSQLIQNGFSQVGYASAEQTCSLKQNANDNTNRVIAKLDQMEDSRKDREIASLTAQLAAATSRAERAAELAPIVQKLNDIGCKQPKTETIYAPSVVGVPACTAFNALYGGYGFNPFGLNQAWN